MDTNTIENRIKYLEGLTTKSMEDKYINNFKKYASYLGNGVYEWRGIRGTDTREVFLMGVLKQEKIEFEEI